jgi:hypothetical protein
MGYQALANVYADWNQNNELDTTSYEKDINGDSRISILTDYNDWANLFFAFSREISGARDGVGIARATSSKYYLVDPIASNFYAMNPVISEPEPDPDLIREIKRINMLPRAK